MLAGPDSRSVYWVDYPTTTSMLEGAAGGSAGTRRRHQTATGWVSTRQPQSSQEVVSHYSVEVSHTAVRRKYSDHSLQHPSTPATAGAD